MPKKIDSYLKKLVLGQKNKASYLGVRKLAALLNEKYKINISKSTVQNILKARGVQEKRGRKKAFSLYKIKPVEPCGLLLLRAIDSYIGLFDYLANALAEYFLQLDRNLLKRLIILASFSAFIGDSSYAGAKHRGFLRVISLFYLPRRKINYFNTIISQNRPAVSLKPLKEDLRFTSSLKFYFKNGYSGFCDAKMLSFWDSPPTLEHFFLPQRIARLRILKMLEDKAIFVGYTKSFDYLSFLAINFLGGINSGIEKIEFLDENAASLGEIKPQNPKPALFFGYSPKTITKGIKFLSEIPRFRKVFWPELGEFFSASVMTNFLQPKIGQNLNLNNTLIKKNLSTSPSWGIITNFPLGTKKAYLDIFLKKYLYFWPYIMEDFFQDMEVIEKAAFSTQKSQNYLAKMFPEKLQFSQPSDFTKVGLILSVIFKEIVWGWEPKAKSGDFRIKKDHIAVQLRQASPELIAKFNRIGFFIDKKRVFLV